MRSMSAVVETALVASFTLSSPFREEHEHEVSVRGHERIVDAIEARDGPAAAAAMRAIIGHGVGRIAQAVAATRTGERRGGKEGVSQCRARWWPSQSKKTTQ